MEFIFIRHAESEGNVQGIMQGRKDYPLSALGWQQSQCLTDYLHQDFFQSHLPTAIYCSPLQRTRQTIAAYQELRSDIPFVLSEQLIEVDSGIFSGLNWQEALERHPEICQQFKQAGDWGVVPEGESREMLWQRARGFLDQIQSQHPKDARILIMTHGGFVRAALSILAGIVPDEKLFVCIDNTSISIGGIHTTRRYIRTINDTRHLKSCDYIPEFSPL